MKWVLIRHGQTRGNLEHRYIGGRTDEPLCPQGIEKLKLREYPKVQRVFVSPMLRCRQTAEILYPDIKPEMIEDFRECDFGAFENKSYQELSGQADYQAWIDSLGERPFPGGESRAQFAKRCADAFEELTNQGINEDCALIVHGGTIMAIMERYAVSKRSYYDFQVKNGEGYILFDDGHYEKL